MPQKQTAADRQAAQDALAGILTRIVSPHISERAQPPRWAIDHAEAIVRLMEAAGFQISKPRGNVAPPCDG